MSFTILGIGCQAPNYSIEQSSAAEHATSLCCFSEEQARLLKVLYRRSRVKRRSSVLLEPTRGIETHDFYSLPTSPDDRGPGTQSRMKHYEEHAGRLALEASRRALTNAAVDAGDVTHLITISCTGFFAPGMDFELISGLGLPVDVGRANLGFMGCNAALNAFRLAGAISDSDPKARVLIAAVELCSLHFQYGWNADSIVSNSLFSDGAGAIVGGSTEQEGEGHWALQSSGSRFLPESTNAMTWRIGDHGFLMTLSPRVPSLLEQHLASWVDDWLDRNGLRREEVKTWAVHPGGPRILRSARQSLGISPAMTQVSQKVLSDYGNMSSATLFFILREFISKRAPLPCVALGFGPGLSIEAALFVSDSPGSTNSLDSGSS